MNPSTPTTMARSPPKSVIAATKKRTVLSGTGANSQTTPGAPSTAESFRVGFSPPPIFGAGPGSPLSVKDKSASPGPTFAGFSVPTTDSSPSANSQSLPTSLSVPDKSHSTTSLPAATIEPKSATKPAQLVFDHCKMWMMLRREQIEGYFEGRHHWKVWAVMEFLSVLKKEPGFSSRTFRSNQNVRIITDDTPPQDLLVDILMLSKDKDIEPDIATILVCETGEDSDQPVAFDDREFKKDLDRALGFLKADENVGDRDMERSLVLVVLAVSVTRFGAAAATISGLNGKIRDAILSSLTGRQPPPDWDAAVIWRKKFVLAWDGQATRTKNLPE